MAQKDPREICAELAQPFAPEDLEWRLQKVNEQREGKEYGIAVPYVTNRAIQNRLDEVVGPDNWYNEYKPWHGDGKKQAQICGISIHFEGKGFITKWDGAEDSDIEPVKGGLSDSMKRAAVQWGIGRVLYSMDTVYVDVEKKGKTWVIASSARSKLDNAYLSLLAKLKLTPAPAGGIQSLLTPKATGESGNPQDVPGTEPGDNSENPKENISPAEKAQDHDAQSTRQPQPPQYEYIVRDVRIQKGMTESSTQVILEDPAGKRYNAFVRGERPDLVKNTLLTGTKLTLRKQDTVVFYVLERYQIAAERQQAA